MNSEKDRSNSFAKKLLFWAVPYGAPPGPAGAPPQGAFGGGGWCHCCVGWLDCGGGP